MKQAIRKFSRDRASRLAAALAFHMALSLAPLLLVVIGVLGLSFGESAARGEIARELQGFIGGESADIVQSMLAQNSAPSGVIATVIGFVLLLAAAVGAFESLQDALNTVWDAVPEQPSSGMWRLVKDEFLSIAMIGGMALLLMVSLAFSAIFSGLRDLMQRGLPYARVWIGAADMCFSMLLTGAMFTMIFRYLPRTRPRWSAVWRGALVTAVFLSVGKVAIGLYLGYASPSSIYGAAGSFIALLIWLYYSSHIVLFGAEITRLLGMLDS